MPRPVLAAFAVALTVVLTACTDTPGQSPSGASSEAPTGSPSVQRGLPECAAVGAALGALVVDLPYDELASTPSITESYEQRVCVFGPVEGRIGVTIAAIPFLQTELDTYGASPNALVDARTGEHGAVLQTLLLDDGADGHLDAALYLFDLEYSITIQETGTAVLPRLSVSAATDGIFAVRALID